MKRITAMLLAVALLPLAELFPRFYNTEDDIRALATYFIIIQALATPMWSFTNACYFTLRSGGKTGVTFLFDFVYTWMIQIPLAYILSHFTHMDIHLLFAVVTYAEIIKVIVGYLMVRSNTWIKVIVS